MAIKLFIFIEPAETQIIAPTDSGYFIITLFIPIVIGIITLPSVPDSINKI